MTTAGEIIERLDLAPHPEGGWYAETWRSAPYADGRSAGTAIYYLLEAGQESAWHRVDADETWHFYAGESLELRIRASDGVEQTHRLGTDLMAGERPQFVVPTGVWQAARPLGPWTLVGCTVSPGFTFDGFELESREVSSRK
jgi:uncharacterized protein